MKNLAIQVQNVSKSYNLGSISSSTFADDFQNFLNKFLGNENQNSKIISDNDLNILNNEKEIWALNNVSFDVKKGEIVGIIGKNGAGKSTLLKVLSRITSPTKGIIKINGKLASLLEVGTGFHPELTGKQNIFLNGAILGMTKTEIQEKLFSIIEFSGIEKYINTPVKRYSSGMVVRLGFSVAAFLDPDILLIDEVLAVGDADFQKKCIGKIKDISETEGRTIIFVSHNLSAINNLCTRGILISQGRIIFDGDTSDAINSYMGLNNKSKNKTFINFDNDNKKPAQIRSLTLTDFNNKQIDKFEFNQNVCISISIDLNKSYKYYRLAIAIIDSIGNWVFSNIDSDNSNPLLANAPPDNYVFKLKLPSKILKPGIYYIRVVLDKEKETPDKAIDISDCDMSFEIIDTITKRGMQENYNTKSIIAPEVEWELQT